MKLFLNSTSKLKKLLHSNWRKPNLNAEQNHLASVPPCPFLSFFFFFFFFFFCVPLSSIILLSLTLIIGIFYCLNYTLLLLHLITMHLVSHLSVPSIVFIISVLIIGIFCSLNYILPLLHLFITHLVIDFVITM